MLTLCKDGQHTFVLVARWSWKGWRPRREPTLECVYCYTVRGMDQHRRINGTQP